MENTHDTNYLLVTVAWINKDGIRNCAIKLSINMKKNRVHNLHMFKIMMIIIDLYAASGQQHPVKPTSFRTAGPTRSMMTSPLAPASYPMPGT